MNSSYLFNPVTRMLLENFALNPKGSIFIDGLSELDLKMATNYLLDHIYKDTKLQQGYVFYLKENNLEALKQIIQIIHKTRFNQNLARLIVIDQAHKISSIMQNTLLKSLEEPPLGSHFIFTSTNAWQVLPTLISRCQIIKIKKPLKKDLLKRFSDIEAKVFEQAYLASDGWFNTMDDYLNNPDSLIHQEIKLAKKFIQLPPDKRLELLIANEKTDDEDLADKLEVLINGLWRICRATFLTAASNNKFSVMEVWRYKFALINQLKTDFDRNLNLKIISLNLSLKL